MIYIYILSFFALIPIFSYVLKQTTPNKGYVIGLSLLMIALCIYSFVGKTSFLGSFKMHILNKEILEHISSNVIIPIKKHEELSSVIKKEDLTKWYSEYINKALIDENLISAEDLISKSERYFITNEEKFIFYSFYKSLRDKRFPEYSQSKFVIEFEPIDNCDIGNSELKAFITNGPDLPIALIEFPTLQEITITNDYSLIPGFDISSAILNNESVDLEINLSCNDSVDKISFNSTFLLNSNNLFNSYKIQANQWLKKEQ